MAGSIPDEEFWIPAIAVGVVVGVGPGEIGPSGESREDDGGRGGGHPAKEFGYRQVGGCAVFSKRCLARGIEAWSHWKPGWRIAKKGDVTKLRLQQKD